MNASQSNHLARGQSVSTALETITATRVSPALSAVHAALNTTLSHIRDSAAIQALPTTGVTKDRDQVFATATNATLVVAGLVLSYAKSENLGDLAAKVDLSPYHLNYGRFHARVLRMQQVHDAAAAYLPELADFEVTAAQLADLQTKIAAARALLSVTRDKIAVRHVATRKVAEAFVQLKQLIDDRLDPLMAARRESDPDSYKLYRAARLVIDRRGTSGQSTPTPAPADASTAATSPTPSDEKLAA